MSGDLVISYQQRSRSGDVFPDDGAETFVDWETITRFRCFIYDSASFNPSSGLLATLDDDQQDGRGSNDPYEITINSALRNTIYGSTDMPTQVFIEIHQLSELYGLGIRNRIVLDVE